VTVADLIRALLKCPPDYRIMSSHEESGEFRDVYCADSIDVNHAAGIVFFGPGVKD